MNSYIRNEYTGRAAGPEGAALARQMRPRRNGALAGARTLSSFLLATVLAVLIVLADRLVDAWSDGHLVVAVLVLWLVLFAGLAVFARSTRRLAITVAAAYQAWVELDAQEPIETAPPGLGAASQHGNAAAAQQGKAYTTPQHRAGKVFYRPW